MDEVVATALEAVADVGNSHATALLLVGKEGLQTTGRELLARRRGGIGVAALRIGVGQGLALVLERQGTQETP
ncbi:hypothetical protein [Streptomyces sp. NPDC050121]|uniref:hypothetical protein n=1 Tax=Streptomyces sp. NPDC050121 TaxID=3365601 RepID=UPI0037BBD67D